MAGEVARVPVAVGFRFEDVQDALPAAVVRRGVAVVVRGGGQVGLGCKDGDGQAGDGAAGVRTAVVFAVVVSGRSAI